MSEASKTIKVVDRRMFTAEGDLRDDVMEELAKAPPAPLASPEEAPAAPPPERAPGTLASASRMQEALPTPR